ncbi:hypothetical protein ELG97_37205 [Rhizobium leguminosarum]|uniref:hypothetical protein n=1 Tax=Rhizobium leguminosarum TaxID=384 RepID=UPI0010305FDB|nr:hypothetical protein [Rhizobium leguminosarum]TBE73870.1 hypothetical protein ELG97_37205 [Rhizobium leguminosarum]
MKKHISRVFNMIVVIGLILVSAVFVRHDHAWIAKALIAAYFAGVLFLLFKTEGKKAVSSVEFASWCIALVFAIGSYNVVRLASMDHLAQVRAENPTMPQMAVADDYCPTWQGEPLFAYCKLYRQNAEKWREASAEYRAQSAAALKQAVDKTTTTGSTDKGLWN